MLEPAVLENLRDIHMPYALSWWPPAPIWLILFGVIIIGIASTVILHFIHKKNRLEKLCLQLIDANISSNKNNFQKSLQDINIFVKKYAISKYGRKQVASLENDLWFKFLNSKHPNELFNDNVQATITKVIYGRSSPKDTDTIIACYKKWIKENK